LRYQLRWVITPPSKYFKATSTAIKLSTFGAVISIADMRMNSHPLNFWD
jgi:hypothetical protein